MHGLYTHLCLITALSGSPDGRIYVQRNMLIADRHGIPCSHFFRTHANYNKYGFPSNLPLDCRRMLLHKPFAVAFS